MKTGTSLHEGFHGGGGGGGVLAIKLECRHGVFVRTEKYIQEIYFWGKVDS